MLHAEGKQKAEIRKTVSILNQNFVFALIPDNLIIKHSQPTTHSPRTELSADTTGITCQSTVTRLSNSGRNPTLNGVFNRPYFRSRAIDDSFRFWMDYGMRSALNLPGASARTEYEVRYAAKS